VSPVTQVRTASSYFIYDAPLEIKDGQSVATTIVYCSSPEVSAREIGTALAYHFESATYPQQIWLLGTEDLKDTLQNAAAHSDIVDRIPAITRYYNGPNVLCATINRAGTIRLWEDLPLDLPEHICRELFTNGLTQIFQTHEGVLNASAGYHYVKPSSKHSDHFLRTANVLKYGNEISFMAAALLSRLPKEPLLRIYTDTASINSVGYALAGILARLNPDKPTPTINSFGSYVGLKGEFEIEQESGSVVLISASTSGSIVNEIEESQGITRSRQVIIYFVGDEDESLNILCDLTSRPGNNGYIAPINSWAASDCPLCQLGQSTVHVGGDQFLPANPTISARMIVAQDAPSWLSPFMESVYGRDAVRCHSNLTKSEHPFRTFLLDLTEIINPPNGASLKLADKLTEKLIRHVPASTKWLVHLDDDDSLALAKRIQKELAEVGIVLPDDRIVNSSELIKSGTKELGDGLALIVASAVVTGRSILSLSRSLRQAHKGQPLAFLIVVARMADDSQWRELSVNLTYANSNPKAHELNVVESIHLPADRFETGTPWQRESALWKLLRDDLTPSGELGDPAAQVRAIDERLLVIDGAPSNGGLRFHLFLDGQANGLTHPLSLQPNFAFWRFTYLTDGTSQGQRIPTQADVFFTITAILHNLRQSKKARHAPLAHDHNWTVIAPRNFARFNDAVIQASLLRAALPRELDYSSDEGLSLHMLSVIQEALSAWHSTEGAAAGEFLLALALRRVRLTPADLHRLVENNDSQTDSWPTLHQVLWTRIRESDTYNPSL
jgi:hypothetical protein